MVPESGKIQDDCEFLVDIAVDAFAKRYNTAWAVVN